MENVSEDAPAVNSPLSSLSAMMIECTRVALLEKDYVNALENILTVASVDDHPEVTFALAAAILDIAGALRLARGAADTKAQILSPVTPPGFDQTIRQCLDHDSLVHILGLTRRRATDWLGAWRRRDKVAQRLVKNISRAASGGSTENPPSLRAYLLRRLQRARAPARLSSLFRWLSWPIAPARNLFARIKGGTIYIFTGLLLVIGPVLILAAISAFIYFVRGQLSLDSNIVPPLAANDCFNVSSASKYLLDFFVSGRGVITILLLLALRASIRRAKKVRRREVRELAAALIAGLIFLICSLILGSSGIMHFAKSTARIADVRCPPSGSLHVHSHGNALRG